MCVDCSHHALVRVLLACCWTAAGNARHRCLQSWCTCSSISPKLYPYVATSLTAAHTWPSAHVRSAHALACLLVGTRDRISAAHMCAQVAPCSKPTSSGCWCFPCHAMACMHDASQNSIVPSRLMLVLCMHRACAMPCLRGRVVRSHAQSCCMQDVPGAVTYKNAEDACVDAALALHSQALRRRCLPRRDSCT